MQQRNRSLTGRNSGYGGYGRGGYRGIDFDPGFQEWQAELQGSKELNTNWSIWASNFLRDDAWKLLFNFGCHGLMVCVIQLFNFNFHITVPILLAWLGLMLWLRAKMGKDSKTFAVVIIVALFGVFAGISLEQVALLFQ